MYNYYLPIMRFISNSFLIDISNVNHRAKVQSLFIINIFLQ